MKMMNARPEPLRRRREPVIQDGDLIRCCVPVVHYTSMVTRIRYGTVLSTSWPMLDEHEWTDHRVIWHDNGEETLEWCGDLELVSEVYEAR